MVRPMAARRIAFSVAVAATGCWEPQSQTTTSAAAFGFAVVGPSSSPLNHLSGPKTSASDVISIGGRGGGAPRGLRLVPRRQVLEESAAVFVATTACISIALPSPATASPPDEPPPPPPPPPQGMEGDSSSTTPIRKPYAPVEYLLPAARVKWTIDRAVSVAAVLEASKQKKNADEREDSLLELRSLLLEPQSYMRGPSTASSEKSEGGGGSVSPADRGRRPLLPGKEYMDAYAENRRKVDAVFKPGALLVQSGEIAAWLRLQGEERQKEQQDEIREALNTYTNALTFKSDSYLLNLPAQQRSELIRQERLPDVKQVVQSDLDLRTLYRNELLTAIQDARAELEYQLRQQSRTDEGKSQQQQDTSDGDSDYGELLELLRKAQSASDKWFSFIDDGDVKEAMQLVEKEQREVTSSPSS